MYGLDTNVAIAVLRRQPATLVERVERELAAGPLALPVIALFELRYGVARSDRRAENEARLALFLESSIEVWPFEPEDAEEAGEIRAMLAGAGRPIGPYDILIAAQARRRRAVLVTANTREFARVPGLLTEDWSAD